MSFLGGPECSTAANPLAQFSKQTQRDNTLQQDRLASRQGQNLGFRSQGGSQAEEAAFQEFSQQNAPQFGPQLPNEQFHLEQLRRESERIERNGGGWAGEFAGNGFPGANMQQMKAQHAGPAWSSNEFAQFRNGQSAAQSRFESASPVSQSQQFYGGGGAGYMGMQRSMFQNQYFRPSEIEQQQNFQGKGKERVQELSDTDWEKQFSELSTADERLQDFADEQFDQEANAAMERELGDLDKAKSTFLKSLAELCKVSMRLSAAQHQAMKSSSADGAALLSDADAMSSDANAALSDLEAICSDLYAMLRQSHQLNKEQHQILEEKMRRAWENIELRKESRRRTKADHLRAMADQAEAINQWKDFDGDNLFDDLRTLDPDGGREIGNYMFEEDNIFKDVPNAYEEGLKILREGGNLSLAALAFEAAVQKNPEFIEAWVALGQAQAQNEKEVPAIRALEHALNLDPNNLDALMGLSVSYTNEGYDSLTYRTLERWIGLKYPQLGVKPRGLAESSAEELSFTDRHQLHEKVTNLFLEAATLNPEGSAVDVDVQVGLGVLFYGSEDYDKAVDCFNVALNSAQHGSMKREGEEHLLWNRLGATLANSGRSEEAIEAYSRALEIRNNFVRARYNLGVSCINLGVLEEAASHLLGALSMHKVIEAEGKQKAAELLKDGNGNDVPAHVVDGQLQQNQSTNLLDTLRRVFNQMDRRDLAEKVGADMNLDVFRKDFDF